MVIQTHINDGISVKTKTYRNVIKGVNLAQFREGFYAQKVYSRWGQMFQLKGKQRILLASFGLPNMDTETLVEIAREKIKIPITDQSTTYVGRFVETIDTYDGVAGDEDYEAYEYKYLRLELEKV